jgi:hypothetical protein
MVNVNELSPPSNSLKAADLNGEEWEVTIQGYTVKEFDQESVETGESYKVKKPIFSFHETEKTLVCNKTNRDAIAYAYGDEMDDWIGKVIFLYPTMVPFGNKKVEAIRVRAVKASKPKLTRKTDERNPPPIGDDEIPF